MFHKVPKNTYLVISDHHIFACKAHTRQRAIEIALNSNNDFSPKLSEGRPSNTNVKVIMVRPWHRYYSQEEEYLYILIPKNGGRPQIYDKQNWLLNMIIHAGAVIQRVKLYEDDDAFASDDYTNLTYPGQYNDPYEIV